jgi:16S rRNA U516 pseudouridylate synthase RsuA-like enzyme
MMASRNMHVTYLQRVQEGNLTLDGLPLGQVRHLSTDEIDELLTLCGGIKID